MSQLHYERIAAMKSVLITNAKANWGVGLGAITGVMIGTVYSRANHHRSPLLDWDTFAGAVGGVLLIFLIRCLWIWYRQSHAQGSNA